LFATQACRESFCVSCESYHKRNADDRTNFYAAALSKSRKICKAIEGDKIYSKSPTATNIIAYGEANEMSVTIGYVNKHARR